MAKTISRTSRWVNRDYENEYSVVGIVSVGGSSSSGGGYTKSEAHALFVDINGDTMTGDLTVPNLTASGTLGATGNIQTAGSIIANTFFRSSDTFAILGTNSDGTVHLRPDGYTQSTNQSTFTTTQATIGTPLEVTGAITVTGTVDGRDVAGDGTKLDNLYDTIGLKDLTAGEVNQLENIGTVAISNTQWGYLGALDQSLTQASAVTFATVNTGHGANELYAMDQAVRTTDSPTFAVLTITGNLVVDTDTLYVDSSTDRVGVNTTNPDTAFHVIGDSGIIKVEGTGTAGYIQFDEGASIRGYMGYTDGGGLFTGAGTNSMVIRSEAALHFGASGNNLQMTLDGTSVGINTTTPSATFHVVGDIMVSTDIGSETYSSGFAGSGWQFDASEDRLTVDNLTVRKQMRIYELLVEQVRANRGALVVSPGNGKIASVSGSTATVDTGDDDRFPISLAANDIIRCQRFSGNGTTVSTKYYLASVDSVTGNDFTFTIIDGTDTVEAEDEVVVVGNSSNTDRQGLIYITSSDDNAPYIDILDGVTDGDFSGHRKVRLGELTGITDADLGTLSGYGLFSDNVYLKGTIIAPSGEIGGWTITTDTLHKDSHIVLDATNKAISVNNSTFGNDGIQLQYNSGNPRAYIGDGANKYFNFDGTNISWKATNTELTTAGNLTATNATLSGTITATAGAIGGWDVTSDGIRKQEGDDNIYISNQEAVGSSNYGRGITIVQAAASNPVGNVKAVRFGQLADKDTTYDMSTDYGVEIIKRTDTYTYEHILRIGGSEALIGGWTIDSDAIYTGTKKTSDGFSTSGVTLASNGALHAKNFYLDSDGDMGLRSSTSGKRIEISSTDNAIYLWTADTAEHPRIYIDEDVYGGRMGMFLDGPANQLGWLLDGYMGISGGNGGSSFSVDGRNSDLKIRATDLPTSSTGLLTGELYQSGGYIRIKT